MIDVMSTKNTQRVTPETSLTDAVRMSVERNTELNHEVDAPTIAGAYKIAGQIDNVLDLDALGQISDPQVITKALYLMPHLQNLMRDLLATPVSRVQASKTRAESKQTKEVNSNDGSANTLSLLRAQQDKRNTA